MLVLEKLILENSIYIYDILKYYIEKQINCHEINQVINNIKTAIEIYEKKTTK